MRDRLRSIYDAWDGWSKTSGSARAYLLVMTPGLFVVAAYFAWVGGWTFAIACTVLGLFAASRLRRSRQRRL